MLSEYRGEPMKPEWQVIDTAPTDGRDILVCWANKPWFRPLIMHYEDGYFGTLTTDFQFFVQEDMQPTHWMHLPEPPNHEEE
jgi:hypothetical protein